MTIDTLTQILISVFGVSALLLSLTVSRPMRRAGVVLGLLGQPAWYAQLVIHDQWGMLPAFLAYTLVWCFGFWNLWIRPAMLGWEIPELDENA